MLGGYAVVRFSYSPISVMVGGGWNSSAGFILGGSMILFGAVAWFAPHYSRLVGVMGVLFALAAFIGSNLGGFLIGSLLGILGGSMIWGWGEKPQRDAAEAEPAVVHA